MRVDNVKSLIDALDKSNPIVQKCGYSLLDFIYRDVYDLIEKEKEKAIEENSSNGFMNSKSGKLNKFESFLSKYLDGNDSIVSYFEEMVKDDKSLFMAEFINSTTTFFRICKNKYYNRSDFKPEMYSLNLYFMLYGYHIYKDNLGVYKNILKRFSMFRKFDFLEGRSWQKGDLDSEVEFVKFILSSKAFLYNPDKFAFIEEQLFSYYGFSDSFVEQKKKQINCFDKLYTDYEELKNVYSTDKLCDFNMIAKDVFSDKYSDIYYSKVLLIGDRFEYFNNNFLRVIDNSRYRDYIFDILDELDCKTFDFLDSSISDDDSFKICFNSLFDSDTWYEVSSKLDLIKEINYLYTRGYTKEALERYRDINSLNHKFKDEGKTFVFGCNTNNIVEKPRSINGRMLKLYHDVYDEHSNIVDLMVRKVLDDSSMGIWNVDGKANSLIKEKIIERQKEFANFSKAISSFEQEPEEREVIETVSEEKKSDDTPKSKKKGLFWR